MNNAGKGQQNSTSFSKDALLLKLVRSGNEVKKLQQFFSNLMKDGAVLASQNKTMTRERKNKKRKWQKKNSL